jgi:mRNA interferase HigB
MVVISKTILNEFSRAHPSAEKALVKWYELTKSSDWKNFSDLIKTFSTADVVANDRYVFNVKGNQYRIVALIIFKVRTVFVLFVGTHTEYDNIDVATINYKK